MNSFKILPLLSVLVILTGCMTSKDGIGVSRARKSASREYYGLTGTTIEGLSFDTRNYLTSNLLFDQYRKNPDDLVQYLKNVFAGQKDPRLLSVIADINYNTALNESNPDKAIRSYLTAAYAYYTLLFRKDIKINGLNSRFSPQGLNSLIRYNLCVACIFKYCAKKNLLNKRNFEIPISSRNRISFPEKPLYKLNLNQEELQELLPCSDFQTEDLLLFVQKFGIGVPMIARFKEDNDPKKILHQMRETTIPVTCLLRFSENPDPLKNITARFELYDPDRDSSVDINGEKVSLASDMSTPLAWKVEQQKSINLIATTRNAYEEKGRLLSMEPCNRKIPVVFIHGLLSSPFTWIQLVNTLRANEEIRKNYQFWFYKYSSGNPVLASSAELRESLDKIREDLIKRKCDTRNFDRMVLIGHSMGGLVARTFAAEGGDYLVRKALKTPWADLQKKITPEQCAVIKKYMLLTPKPYVKRIVFMAVPHRGSSVAERPIAAFGSSLIKLPNSMIRSMKNIYDSAAEENSKYRINDVNIRELDIPTGVMDLKPTSHTLQALNAIPLSKNIVYHSIMGNRKAALVPGGSDGLVPYSSSHIDEAVSELIVKSGHSVQNVPETMHELERILRLHLKECR